MNQKVVSDILCPEDDVLFGADEMADISGSPSQDQASERSTAQSWGVDSYADRLMDELFEDVDRLLEGELPPEAASRPSQSFGAAPNATPPVQVGDPGFPVSPPNWGRVPLASSITTTSGTGLRSPTEAEAAALAQSGEQVAKPTQGWAERWLDGMLWGAICICLAAAAGMAYANYRGLNPLVAMFKARQQQTVPPPTPTIDPQAAADERFVKYVRRSLAVLGQQSNRPAVASASPAASPLPSLANLPTVATNGNLAAPQPSTVLDRVYIPVNPVTPGVVPPPIAQLPSVNVPGTLMPAPVTVVPPPLPPLAASPNATPTTVAAAPLPPATTYTLVGVLASTKPSQSAALFDVNGVTQRIYVGETIGNTGWTLVKVINQEAVVRRNGQVRTVFVGQQF